MALPLIAGAIGAGAGILGSLFGGGGTKQLTPEEALQKAEKDRYLQYMLTSGQDDRGRILAQQMDPYARAGQVSLAQQYAQMASGQGPSLAALQAQQSLAQGGAQQAAMAASANPANGFLANRQAAQQIGQMAGSTAGAAAQARIQEQLGAQQALASLYSSMIGQQQAQQGMQNQSLSTNYQNMLAGQQARLGMAGYYGTPQPQEQNWFGKLAGGIGSGIGGMMGAGLFSGGNEKKQGA